MAIKIDKDFLLKNQFWVMLGAAVFLWLVSLVWVFLGPAKKASAEAKAFAKTQDEYKNSGKDPKNASFNTAWNQREKEFREARDKIWEAAWRTQIDQKTKAHYMTWPRQMQGDLEKAYFGDPIKPDSRDRYRNREYDEQFPSKQNPSLDVFMGVRAGEQAYFPIVYDTKVLGQH